GGLTFDICIECSGLFASKSDRRTAAPTRFLAGKKKRCTDQAHRKAVEHTTKCLVKADQSSSANASAVHS
ncbi:hypothetical protein, partial [Pseudomonas sp. BF-B-26]|uniref:hypothetical protein n=1 Tax=Pseudomonas sp. BF-B-26 TaxID=2832400 RepID=UPI001CC19795